MTRLRLFPLVVIGVGLGFAGLAPAMFGSSAAWAAGDTVRKEVGEPLQKAKQAINQKNFKMALGWIEKAEKASDKTMGEIALIKRMRLAAVSDSLADDILIFTDPPPIINPISGSSI
jgi:hypothetical protein